MLEWQFYLPKCLIDKILMASYFHHLAVFLDNGKFKSFLGVIATRLTVHNFMIEWYLNMLIPQEFFVNTSLQ